MDWIKAFRAFNVPPTRYLLQYVLPIFAGGMLFSLVVTRLLADVSPLIRVTAATAAPLFALWGAIMIPQVLADRRRREIDNNIHFYVTHMGVLATANLPPVDILAKLGGKKEYGALATASEEIASLVRSWNMGLPEACRFAAERTQSLIFADFLERFAYALETGEDLMAFLHNEQAVVMGDYATQYQANLYSVDSVKDMYMSTMMSVIFLVIFGLISPILTGVDPGGLTWVVAGLVTLMEVIFLMLIVMRAPNDLMWASSEERVGVQGKIAGQFPFAFLASAVAFLITISVFGTSFIFALSVGATPLIYVGWTAAKQEAAIRRKDDNYPAFIRSLGASTTARGGSPKEVLKRLRRHDFGPLTDDVEGLYRRLNLRLDDERAWERFATESSSNIIQKFTAMFTEGINAGGDAASIGRIVSDNVVRIISLRKHREQGAAGFRGMMLGMTAGMAGTLFIGVGLLRVLKELFDKAAESSGPVATGFVLADFAVNIPVMTMIITGVMVLHALIGAYMITLAGGGSAYKMAGYVPAMLWITWGASLGADLALSAV